MAVEGTAESWAEVEERIAASGSDRERVRVLCDWLALSGVVRPELFGVYPSYSDDHVFRSYAHDLGEYGEVTIVAEWRAVTAHLQKDSNLYSVGPPILEVLTWASAGVVGNFAWRLATLAVSKLAYSNPPTGPVPVLAVDEAEAFARMYFDGRSELIPSDDLVLVALAESRGHARTGRRTWVATSRWNFVLLSSSHVLKIGIEDRDGEDIPQLTGLLAEAYLDPSLTALYLRLRAGETPSRVDGWLIRPYL